jgi:peptidyl-tRNA hydrolase
MDMETEFLNFLLNDFEDSERQAFEENINKALKNVKKML